MGCNPQQAHKPIIPGQNDNLKPYGIWCKSTPDPIFICRGCLPIPDASDGCPVRLRAYAPSVWFLGIGPMHIPDKKETSTENPKGSGGCPGVRDRIPLSMLSENRTERSTDQTSSRSIGRLTLSVLLKLYLSVGYKSSDFQISVNFYLLNFHLMQIIILLSKHIRDYSLFLFNLGRNGNPCFTGVNSDYFRALNSENCGNCQMHS